VVKNQKKIVECRMGEMGQRFSITWGKKEGAYFSAPLVLFRKPFVNLLRSLFHIASFDHDAFF
jgi:hypothetical protein